MAKTVLRNQKIFIGGLALSDRMNAVALDYKCEPKDATSFDDAATGFRTRLAGVKDLAFGADGFVELDANDAALFSGVGGAATPIALPLDGDTVGNAAYFFEAIRSGVTLDLQQGELYRFKVMAEGAGDVARGKILHASGAAVSASGNGAAVQLAATDSGERLYAALHVIAASGTTPTLDVKIQSDDASGMSSPTDVVTFTQASATGAEALSALPNSADDYYRVSYTVGGTDPSFAFLVVVGIL